MDKLILPKLKCPRQSDCGACWLLCSILFFADSPLYTGPWTAPFAQCFPLFGQAGIPLFEHHALTLLGPHYNTTLYG